MNLGFDPGPIHRKLFPFQTDIVKWACRKGKSAIWAGTGLGKTFMQVAWADQVTKRTGGRVLILAPLAVSSQTIGEAKKIDVGIERFKPLRTRVTHKMNFMSALG